MENDTRSRPVRAVSAALPFLMALVIPLAMTVANVQGSSGGTGTGGGSSATGSKYERLWQQASARDKRWARRTSDCESGGDPRIHGGGGSYHGAFQFMLSTWRSAPKSPGGDPHRYSWRTQAVVAVHLMHRDGKSAWPVCG